MTTFTQIKETYCNENMTTFSVVSVVEMVKPIKGLGYTDIAYIANQYIAENEYHTHDSLMGDMFTIAYIKNKGLVMQPLVYSSYKDSPLVAIVKIHFKRNIHYVDPNRTWEEWHEHKMFIDSRRRALRAFPTTPIDYDALMNRPPMLLLNGKQIPVKQRIEEMV